MARAPLVLAGLLGQSFLPCEGISGMVVVAQRESMEVEDPKDVWKKLTMLEQPDPADVCHDAVQGDKCYQLVKWSLEQGLQDHPEWFTTFKKSVYKERNFKAIQEILHNKGKANCSKPCPVAVAARPKPPKRSASQLAQAAKADKEAEEKAQKEAELIKEAKAKATEAMQAERRAEEEATHKADDLGKAAEAQAQKEAETQAEIDKVKAELSTLEAMDNFDSPSLEALRAEKRKHLDSLQAHLHVEMNQEVAQREAAEQARKAAAELLRRDTEADARAEKEADEKENLYEPTVQPMYRQSLEDMSPERFNDYLSYHPEELDKYTSKLQEAHA